MRGATPADARTYLISASQYWRRRTPQNVQMTMQTLTLLAELERRSGSVSHARSLLDEAVDVYDRNRSAGEMPTATNKLAVTIQLERGQVLAETGRDEDAKLCFDDAKELAGAIGDHEKELLAARSIGALYMSRLQFAKAKAEYTELIKMPRELTAGDQPTDDLLLDHIKLTEGADCPAI